MSGLFARLRAGLSRSSKALGDGLGGLLGGSRLSAEQLDALEDLLIMADLGVAAAGDIVAALRQRTDLKDLDEQQLRAALATEIAALLAPSQCALDLPDADTPRVIVMAGVNGAGKTTTIGKLAKRFQAEGKSVMLAACDTFRAAAGAQLEVWGERAGVPVVSAAPGADAAGLAFSALEQAIAQKIDILIVDTAGRLQSNAALMDELGKIIRVLGKLDANAPHATLLVLDATTGQNALVQAQAFLETAHITGLIMTKLDGTARGGCLVSVATKLNLPVHFIGVGEQGDDLQEFSAEDFSRALTGADLSASAGDTEGKGDA